jgi:predicted unusual protein kinase regulating ubiquinone biosynthesis (AarF/ABC1/UbiB family)/MFS family permease
VTAPERVRDGEAPAVEVDRDRVRNFVGLALARVGPRAFEVAHGTFLTLLVGARTGSAFMAAFALTAHRLLVWLVYPLAGRVSDSTRSRLGRRAPYLGGGLLVMGVATWSYTVLGGYWPLVLAILVARVANTIRQLAGIVVVPETFGRSRWLRALIAIMIAGTVVSLSLRGTVIATWDEADPSTWAISFRMAAAFMVAAGIAVLLLVRDTAPARKLAEQPRAKEPWRERISEILEVPNARILLAGLFLSVAASGATARLAPLYFREELGAGGAEQSAAIIAGGVLGLVLSIPAGIWLAARCTRRQLAVAAPLVGAAGAAAHLVLTDIWQSVAIGVVTGAFGVGALIALIVLYLQLLPRSGGMGERLGLSAGPFALVGVTSTYVSALAVDVVGNYRVMWLFPTVLGLVHAGLMTRLWVPEWATRVDLRGTVARFSRRRSRRQTEQPAKQRSLFQGEVDPDDVDASVFFEVARHALGNPYAPPRSLDPDEPELAARARRVVSVATAPDAGEVAAVAELLDDDAVLVDTAEHIGQPAVLEQLCGPSWETPHNQTWRLTACTDDLVSFQASPPPPTGEVEVDVAFSPAGHVVRIERHTRPTLAQQADDHARGLGFPVPVAVDLSHPDRRRRRVRVLVTGWVITRHLGMVMVRRTLGRPNPPIKVARGLRRVFERLGGGYVKFGQLVASSPSLFGDDVAEEFRTTLDAGPVVPIAEVRDLITAELGRPWDEVFASIDPEPLGRASIAVVHRAVTTDGRPVAVKVIRPGIEDIMATDLALMEPLFLRLAGPASARLAGPLLQMLQGFRRQVSEELDLRNECRAMARYRSLLADIDLPDVVVPEPFEELSARRVLTMELLDGVAVDDLGRIEELGVDPGPLVEQAVKAWFLTAVVYGSFHGDVHAGNLMLLRDGRIAIIDWGIVARLDPATHGFLRQLLCGALGDEAAWDEIAAFFGDMFGPLLTRAELDARELADLFRPRVEAVLTQPFGQMSLGTLITRNQRSAAEAEGELAAEGRRGRRMRRLRSDQPATPSKAPPFNRGLFLLGKQLMYFERYGRMYMQDVSLLEDREFFRDLVQQRPASVGAAEPEH